MYPLKGEHRWPEKAKEGIIDLTSKINEQAEKEKEKSKEKGKIEIVNKERRSEELDDNLIPLPIMRKDEFKVDGKLPLTLPNKYPIVKSKESMERI